MILADTSAWVEYDRATGSAAHLRLRELIAGSGPVVITEPVITEVCAGARTDARERDLRRLLARFDLAPFDPVADFGGAVAIYRTCRRGGVTPRGLLDCLIAHVALRLGHDVLAHDRDFSRLAGVVGLRLDPASLD
ncbi:MAG: PIN domain nuclease [Nocardioidaceae bacterium]